MSADLGADEWADLEIEVDDLKAFAKSAEGIIEPIRIFTAAQKTKGLGTYSVGQLQGMTIKVEISKAEQDGGGQPAALPVPK